MTKIYFITIHHCDTLREAQERILMNRTGSADSLGVNKHPHARNCRVSKVHTVVTNRVTSGVQLKSRYKLFVGGEGRWESFAQCTSYFQRAPDGPGKILLLLLRVLPLCQHVRRKTDMFKLLMHWLTVRGIKTIVLKTHVICLSPGGA